MPYATHLNSRRPIMPVVDNKQIPYGPMFSIPDKTIRRKMDERLKRFELTAVQSMTIGTIARLEHEGVISISQRDIERYMHTTHATLTEVLKKLELRGFITTSKSTADKRSKEISTTAKALELFDEIHKNDSIIFEELRAGISDEEIEAFTATLTKIIHNCCSKDGCMEETEER